MKEDFFKKLYKNMDKEEIIRVATEDKIRADRNARLLNKSIEKNRELLEEKDKEIERLNNIINELEHHLYQEWLEWKDSDCESIYSRAGEDKAIYDYLQELKGSDKE